MQYASKKIQLVNFTTPEFTVLDLSPLWLRLDYEIAVNIAKFKCLNEVLIFKMH